MGEKFTEKQICDFLTEYTENDKLSLLYKQPLKPQKFDVSKDYDVALVNKKVDVIGTNIKQYNYIAKWLIDHNIKELFEKNDKLKITRKNKTYIIKDHENIINSKDLLINDPNQDEELMAKNLYLRKELDYLGKIMDYQTPIPNSKEDKGVGAVDLLAYYEKDKLLSIIELKNNKNTETLLRAILEICTYYYQLDRENLIKDFVNYFGLSVIEPIRKAVLIYNNSDLHKQYSNEIKYLAETLKVNIFTMEYSESGVIIKEIK